MYNKIQNAKRITINHNNFQLNVYNYNYTSILDKICGISIYYCIIK